MESETTRSSFEPLIEKMGDNGNGTVDYENILRIQTESGEEEIHYPLFYEGLPPEYGLLAEQALGETAVKKEEGLRRLKEFMKKENLSATDNVLIMVLRACKYNQKKSESKLKKYLKLRRNIIQQLCQIEEDEIESILDVAPFGALPFRDKHGRAIITTTPPKSLEKYPMEVIEPLAFALILYTIEIPLSTVCGISYIAEAKDGTLNVFYQVLKVFRKYINIMLDLPTRYARSDVCNENSLVRIFYNAIRAILPQKVTERVQFHGDSYKTLHDIYHPDILPSEFEGNLGPKNDKIYRERLVNFIKILREEGRKQNFSVAEKKNPSF